MLVSSISQSKNLPQQQLQLQQRLQQNSKLLNSNFNDVQYRSTAMNSVQTTLVTSTLVSTITQTLSRVVSIWFRNVRIPTTIFTKKQQVVTDYVTVTSTLAVQPTLLRSRRDGDQEELTDIDPSFVQIQQSAAIPTKTPELLDLDNHFNVLAKQPKVLKAWNQFIEALEEANEHETNH